MADIQRPSEQEVEPFGALVVGLGGYPGVGTTSVARAIAETEHYPLDVVLGLQESTDYADGDPALLEPLKVFKNFIHVPLHQALRHLGYRPPTEQDDHDQQDLRGFHRALREHGRGAEVIDYLAGFHNNIVIVEKIRHPADVVRLLERGGYFVYADAPESVSDQRFLEASSNGKHVDAPNSSARQAELERAKQELTPADHDPHASDILACKPLASEVVNFSGSLAETITRTEQALFRLGLHYLSEHPIQEYQPFKTRRLELEPGEHY